MKTVEDDDCPVGLSTRTRKIVIAMQIETGQAIPVISSPKSSRTDLSSSTPPSYPGNVDISLRWRVLPYEICSLPAAFSSPTLSYQLPNILGTGILYQ